MAEISIPQTKYVRKGECNGCGWCCEVIVRVGLDFIGNDPDWIKVRGIPLTGIKQYDIVDPCPKLSDEKKCNIYPNRPQQCVDFPTHPNEIKDSPCSYWFEAIS